MRWFSTFSFLVALSVSSSFVCADELSLFDPEATSLLGPDNLLDNSLDTIFAPRDSLSVPVSFGAWHWFNTALGNTSGSGYGIPGIRGTYFWWVSATPEYRIDNQTSAGARLEYRFRDSEDGYRPFFTHTTWFYEAYGFLKSDNLGTLKAGQLEKKFGLDWGYGFWPSITNFSGYMQDPDYGVSWEKLTQTDSGLNVATTAQFFVVEDGVNGTFTNADAESVPGLKERNTAVLRVAPTWVGNSGSTLSVGFNGLVQEIDSQIPAFSSSVVSAWGIDSIYQSGPWQVKGEIIQTFGRRVPVHFTSGGPSNRLTEFVLGGQYARGIMAYFLDYSVSFDDNPAATHSLFHIGTATTLSDHATFFVEWVYQRISGNAFVGDAQLFNSLNYTLMWSY